MDSLNRSASLLHASVVLLMQWMLLQTLYSRILAMQNIANVNTEGYSRQRIDLDSISPSAHYAGAVGRGVRVDNVERLHNEFSTQRVIESSSAYTAEETHLNLASRIDALVADEALGLSPALSEFDAALQDAAANPSSAAVREVLLGSGQALATRFSSIQNEFGSTREEVAQRMQADIGEVNDLAQSVADLNRRITLLGTQGGTNEIEDQRDLLIGQIANLIDVKTISQDNGAVDLAIGNGQWLVTDSMTREMRVVPDATEHSGQSLQIGGGDLWENLGDDITTGGSVGGYLAFARDTLAPAEQRLGRLARVIAENINETHRSGIKPDGTVGQGESFTATAPLSIDGLTIALNGTPADGDTYIVSANGGVATGMRQLLTDPMDVALARRLGVDIAIENAGRASINQPDVTDIMHPDLDNAVEIVFTTDDAYDVIDTTSGAALASNVTYGSGDPIEYNGWQTQIAGIPKSGDSFTISSGDTPSTDNGNALALSELQDVMSVNGTTTPVDEYKPSDDPGAIARLVDIEATQGRIDQYSRNADAAESRLVLEETALSSAIETISRLRELAVQANNDTMDDAGRTAIATEVAERFGRLHPEVPTSGVATRWHANYPLP